MFPDLLVSGLSLGSIYGLVALGMVVVFKGTRAVNFAHGEIFATAAFVGYLLTSSGVNYWWAFLGAVLLTTLLGVVIERGAYRPLINASDLSLIIATIAVSFMVKGLVRTAYGARGDFVAYPPIFSFEPLVVYGVFISPQHLAMGIVAVGCMLLFILFFYGTRHGKMMQAVSEDKDAAAIVGVDARQVFLWIWGLGAMLGGLAGVLMAPITLVYPDMGLSILVKSFAAAVLGGFDSLLGAVIGGLLMGVFEQLLGGYLGTMFQDIAGFAVIILVLLIRPSGLFGSKELTRV
jgi:branched-chain amino acid transport system permease protein